MVSRKTFRIYTKTFGGKIWTNLHRVSPGNTFGKKLNRVVFEAFPAKKLCSISYRNSVEFSIFLVPLKFCHSISLSLQVSGTRYCTLQDKLRNITWQVLKWKYLAKKRFFCSQKFVNFVSVSRELFSIDKCTEQFYVLKQFYFVLCCKNAYCLPC